MGVLDWFGFGGCNLNGGGGCALNSSIKQPVRKSLKRKKSGGGKGYGHGHEHGHKGGSNCVNLGKKSLKKKQYGGRGYGKNSKLGYANVKKSLKRKKSLNGRHVNTPFLKILGKSNSRKKYRSTNELNLIH